jgi:predicted RNA-binding Zn-ribbon protein involved in translation (DUF1610 family)
VCEPPLIYLFSDVLRVRCPNCGRAFKNPNTLRAHTSLDCGKLTIFSCHLCKYGSKRKYNLRTHYVSKHGVVVKSTTLTATDPPF